ncbi:MAG: hypothetical protein AAFW95_08325 [Cyanobacteria bacterium J06638_6]
MKTTINRPIPRVTESEIETGGIRVQPKTRPQLTARWSVGADGKLTCRWDIG